MTGALAAREAQSRLISDALPFVELCTVLLVVLAIGLHYRALLAPLITLAAIAITYLITVRVVAWVGQSAGVSVPSEVQPVIVVLLFGVSPTTRSSSCRASACASPRARGRTTPRARRVVSSSARSWPRG